MNLSVHRISDCKLSRNINASNYFSKQVSKDKLTNDVIYGMKPSLHNLAALTEQTQSEFELQLNSLSQGKSCLFYSVLQLMHF